MIMKSEGVSLQKISFINPLPLRAYYITIYNRHKSAVGYYGGATKYVVDILYKLHFQETNGERNYGEVGI